MIIGVIGGVGAGKSTVLNVLSQNYGYEIYRTDDIAKSLYRRGTEVYEEILTLLGKNILSEDGESFDLRKMCGLLYGNNDLMKRVERIVHPRAWQMVYRIIEEKRREGRSIAVETALPTQKFVNSVDECWFVFTDRPVRVKRLEESRGYSRDYAEKIIDRQLDDEDYYELSSFIINNSGTEEETKNEIYEHCKRLKW